MQRKTENALAFIQKIPLTSAQDIKRLVEQEVGSELSAVLHAYASMIMEREPERAMQNASALLLLGYLIRANEGDYRFTLKEGEA